MPIHEDGEKMGEVPVMSWDEDASGSSFSEELSKDNGSLTVVLVSQYEPRPFELTLDGEEMCYLRDDVDREGPSPVLLTRDAAQQLIDVLTAGLKRLDNPDDDKYAGTSVFD